MIGRTVLIDVERRTAVGRQCFRFEDSCRLFNAEASSEGCRSLVVVVNFLKRLQRDALGSFENRMKEYLLSWIVS